jgi:hypothetical protein
VEPPGLDRLQARLRLSRDRAAVRAGAGRR